MEIGNQILKNPVSHALQLIGDRWTIYILRDAFLGRHRFNEFIKYSVQSRVTLTSRLEWLIENDIFYKNQYMEKPPRYEYKLTPKGLGLYPWALMIWQWESSWADQDTRYVPKTLFHSTEQKNTDHSTDNPHKLIPVVVCRHCQESVTSSDTKTVKLDNLAATPEVSKPLINQGTHRRTRKTKLDAEDKSLDHIVDIIGDRWSYLVVAACFFGIRRFDDFQNELEIATNILSDRLKKLTGLGVLLRTQYQDSPKRFEYVLTDKGKSLYPQTLALRQWAIDYLEHDEVSFSLIHTQCGQELNVDVVCDDCNAIPKVNEVSFKNLTDSVN